MSLCRRCSQALLWVPIVLLSVLGCESAQRRLEPPEWRDDFGSSLDTAPITDRSVAETQMLHRRTQLEVWSGAVIPTGFFASNSFEVGPGAGFKASIETSKDLFVGVEFDWANWQQGDGASSVSGSPGALASLRPDQLFDELNRFNMLLVSDYDWMITKSFIEEDKPLKLRLGGGLGATVIDGTVDSFLESQAVAAGGSLSIPTQTFFLARIAASLRWQLDDNLLVFTSLDYDFVAPFGINEERNANRNEVSGDIDFGSISLGCGVVFEF